MRTEVGTKCESCASPAEVRVVDVDKGRRRLVILAAVAAVAVIAVVIAVVASGGGSSAPKTVAAPVGRWMPQSPVGAIRGTAAVVTLKNGQVLAAGGGVGQVPVSAAELFDPQSGKWTPTGSLNEARRGASAVVLANGQVLVTGGVAPPNILATSELYDPATGRFTMTAPMATARLDGTLTVLANGDVLAAGGTTTTGTAGTGAGQSIIPTATAEIYSPSSGHWTATGAMTSSRFEASASVLVDGRVLVVGGLGGPGVASATGLQYPPLASAEIYDPAVGVFTGAGKMSAPRAYQAAARLPDGSVIVAGGSGGPDGLVSLATAEQFKPSTGAWTSVASMTGARTGAAAAIIPGGAVLVAGGESVQQGSTSSLASAELFDPTQGIWKSAGKMACARSGLGAATLGDGTVLEVAGDTAFPGQPPVAQGCVDRYYPTKSGG